MLRIGRWFVAFRTLQLRTLRRNLTETVETHFRSRRSVLGPQFYFYLIFIIFLCFFSLIIFRPSSRN